MLDTGRKKNSFRNWEKHKNAIVSIKIFNPCNIIMQLIAAISKDGDISQWFPNLEIIVDEKETGKFRRFLGLLVWNQCEPLLEPYDLMRLISGDPFQFLTTSMLFGMHDYEDQIIGHLGLSYKIFEIGKDDDVNTVILGNKNFDYGLNVEDFVEKNQKWINNALNLLRQFSYGL